MMMKIFIMLIILFGNWNDLLKIENANFKDKNNNRFYTSLAFINTKTNKLFGKDVSVNLSNDTFEKNNEPRLKVIV